MLPAFKYQGVDGNPDILPKIFPAPVHLAASLELPVHKFKDLVKKEGCKGHHKEIEAKMLLSVTIVVINTIPLILKSIETFVFYFPATSTTLDQGFNIFRCHWKISYPSASIMNFISSIWIYGTDRVTKKVDGTGFGLVVNRNFVHPFVFMASALFIYKLDGFHVIKIFDPFHHMGMVPGFGCKNEMHALIPHLFNTGLVGKKTVSAYDQAQSGMIFSNFGKQPLVPSTRQK